MSSLHCVRDKVHDSQAGAECRQGILTVTLPKASHRVSRVIHIE